MLLNSSADMGKVSAMQRSLCLKSLISFNGDMVGGATSAIISDEVLDELVESCGQLPICFLSVVRSQNTSKTGLLSRIVSILSSNTQNLTCVPEVEGGPELEIIRTKLFVVNEAIIIESETEKIALILMEITSIMEKTPYTLQHQVIHCLPMVLSNTVICSPNSVEMFLHVQSLCTYASKVCRIIVPLLVLLQRDCSTDSMYTFGLDGGQKLLGDKFSANKNDVEIINTFFKEKNCFSLPEEQDTDSEHLSDTARRYQKKTSVGIQDILTSKQFKSSLTHKILFEVKVNGLHFRNYLHNCMKFVNDAIARCTDVELMDLANIAMVTSNQMVISQCKDEYIHRFEQGRNGKEFQLLSQNAIKELDIIATKAADTVFDRFELDARRVDLRGHLDELLSNLRKTYRKENDESWVSFKNKVLNDTRHEFSKIFTSKYPFPEENSDNSEPQFNVYAEKDLLRHAEKTKNDILDALAGMAHHDDHECMKVLRRQLNQILEQITNQYVERNLQNKRSAKDKLIALSNVVLESYKSNLATQISEQTDIHLRNYQWFHQCALEKVRAKFATLPGNSAFWEKARRKILLQVNQIFQDTLTEKTEIYIANQIRLVREEFNSKCGSISENAALSLIENMEGRLLAEFIYQNPFPCNSDLYKEMEQLLKDGCEVLEKDLLIGMCARKTLNTERVDKASSECQRKLRTKLNKTRNANDILDLIQISHSLSTLRSQTLSRYDKLTAEIARSQITINARNELSECVEKELSAWAFAKRLTFLLVDEESRRLIKTHCSAYECKLTTTKYCLKKPEDWNQMHENLKKGVVQAFKQSSPTMYVNRYVKILEGQLDFKFAAYVKRQNAVALNSSSIKQSSLKFLKLEYVECMERDVNGIKSYIDDVKLAGTHALNKQLALQSVLQIDKELLCVGQSSLALKALDDIFSLYKNWNSIVMYSFQADETPIGITLGSSHCYAAYFHGGEVRCVGNKGGQLKVCSFVFTKPNDDPRLIETLAKMYAGPDSETPLNDADKVIGSKQLKSEQTKHSESLYGVRLTRHLLPQNYRSNVLGNIFQHMMHEVQLVVGRKITKAVISVPSNLTSQQRQAVQDAGQHVHLEILEILSNHTAAIADCSRWTLSCGPKTVLVYNIGCQTFELALLKVNNYKVNVLSSTNNENLGGNNIVNELVNLCARKVFKVAKIDIFTAQYSNGVYIRKNVNERLQWLTDLCTEYKIQFSAGDLASIQLPGFVSGGDSNIYIYMHEFNEIVRSLFHKTLVIIEKNLQSRHLSADDIDEIVLVGGTCNIKGLQKLVTDNFPNSVSRVKNLEKTLAAGAAIQATAICSKAAMKYIEV